MVVKDKSYVGDGWGTFKFALRREGWDLGSDFKPVDKLMLPLELI